MNYPTIEEVESADRMQLARWHRFLPTARIGPDFDLEPTGQEEIIRRIEERFTELGRFTPEISKAIGWDL